ncbi:hypothetical protein PMIN03_000344 [Paraphaeosphaeria minitans]|uniref:Uncharacterized protein n=1 Tax=Paraphaeosphaeria minitans TaxID=565426 RepID=A0A9P6KK46_9PLEO|nr:hypothetical protein PMIN01_12911 [Paraphaeosphaeria minitans]
MSSTLTFEIVYSLFHWMSGDISPQVLGAKHRRTSSTASTPKIKFRNEWELYSRSLKCSSGLRDTIIAQPNERREQDGYLPRQQSACRIAAEPSQQLRNESWARGGWKVKKPDETLRSENDGSLGW